MAQQEPKQEYLFHQIQLFKSDTLGSGSYGAVCRAKCDQLICAAKLLYSVFFQFYNPNDSKEHQHPFKKFERECQFLSRINHPNIVQYLGTYHDPESNSPVLLMELMDKSLTHFLESSPGDIPYHTQVNLAYDVAQALAFLHSHGIIHRDLSSNNVLLLANARAKVADFGMSKFIDLCTAKQVPMTMCPGTPAFMSPEALDEPPVYTEKLDNFSFGVLLVQINTRQFPKPTDRFRKQRLVNLKFPNKVIEAKISVPELERRQGHIDLIPPTHPLLPTALQCLKDGEDARPTATQLCQVLTALKEKSMYKESSRQDLYQLLREKDTKLETHQEQLQAFQEKLKQKNSELQETREQLIIKRRDIDKISIRLDKATQENQELRQEQELEKIVESLLTNTAPTEENMIAQQLENVRYEEIVTKLDHAIRENYSLRQDNSTLQHDVRAREEQLRTLHCELQLNEENCAALRQEIKQRNKEISKLRQEQTQALTSKNDLVTVGRWQALPALPGSLWHGSSAVIENKAYFKSSENIVYEFCSNQWNKLLPCPNFNCTIVSIEGMLTAVGGEGKLLPCNKLFRYIDNQWTKHLPSMPTARCNPAAVYSHNTLVVAGGQTAKQLIKSVEVLNIVSRQWSSVSPLPNPLDYPSATICEDHVYIHSRNSGSKQNSVYKCSLEKLILSEPIISATWNEIASLPVSYSSLVTVNGHVLAVGGEKENGDYTVNIHQYMKVSWLIAGHMQYPRSGPLTAALPGNKLMVVGGANAYKKSEIATILS